MFNLHRGRHAPSPIIKTKRPTPTQTAFVFESFLFHQRVDPLAVAGAAVIVAGCVASILAQGARGQVVSSHQKQPSLSLSSSAALAAAVIKEAELAEATGKVAAVRLPAA